MCRVIGYNRFLLAQKDTNLRSTSICFEVPAEIAPYNYLLVSASVVVKITVRESLARHRSYDYLFENEAVLWWLFLHILHENVNKKIKKNFKIVKTFNPPNLVRLSL